MNILKERLDIILVEKGYFQSRERAKASIMAGIVFVDGFRSDKPGTPTDPNSDIIVKENLCPYVSRGGSKLEKAINLFELNLNDLICVDIGASTGGFTDCMLQNGAKKVYCIDVGRGQLDWKLRNDPRIVNMEKINIRYLDFEKIPEPIDFISIDVSFISLKLVLPIAKRLLAENGQIICLVKPQFEAGREQVGKNGIVRDEAVQRQVIERVLNYGNQNGLIAEKLTFSPMTGAKGNIEFLVQLINTTKKIQREVNDDQKDSLEAISNQITNLNINEVVSSAHKELGGIK